MRTRKHLTGRQAIEVIDLRQRVRELRNRLFEEYERNDEFRSALQAEQERNKELFLELCKTTNMMGRVAITYENGIAKRDEIINRIANDLKSAKEQNAKYEQYK